MALTSTAFEVEVDYAPLGAAREVFSRRDPEVVLSGPAGTGKTRGLLEKVHLCASKYPGIRGLLLRKTQADLVGSALVTYQRKVLHPLDNVEFFGGSSREPPAFHYPNGSEILLGGLDKSSKVMSKEFDLVYVNEATEISEDDYESVTTRLRNGAMPYQQILSDCNPGPPTHWLKRRADSGRTVMLESRHEHNPQLWDSARGEWTLFGQSYIKTLDALTGVRKLRLRHGIWAAAEGMVYFDVWDSAIHLISKIPTTSANVDRWGVPTSWPRYWVFDFGYTNPFCWQAWAEDPDGRLYRYAEIYRSQRLVEDHAADILKLHGARMSARGLEWPAGTPRPQRLICDHDAEDRATLERHLGMPTHAAIKSVSPGIQATASRLKKAGDGLPRLFYVRDALVYRDPIMADRMKPTCSEEEIEAYVWDTTNGRRKGEEPVKADDHGMDATRYMVAHKDLNPGRAFTPAVGGTRPMVNAYQQVASRYQPIQRR